MILDQFKLDGKVAIVTGAGRGIGQAYAVGLAEAGADVAIVDVIDMDETIAAIEKLGRRAIGIKADLSKGEKEAPKIVAKVVKAFKKVDILVNNAGIIRREPFAEHSAKNWNDVIAINLSTPFFLSQAVVRQMQKQGRGGKIINIASMLSFQGGILVPGYAASKGAVGQLVKALANEWAGKGVNVNGIAPGYIATDNTAALRADPTRSRQILERIPAGRWGEAEDIAGACVFLCSPAANYIHGAIIPVDGGWLAR